ncbi:MAG: arginase family protein, partial [Proteobacteria bacterium]|nr:arginase family protein [Pseudomonadota bacterium]
MSSNDRHSRPLPTFAVRETFFGTSNTTPGAAISLAGVPLDIATTNRAGARDGPAAIRRASRMCGGAYPDNWADMYDLDFADVGNFSVLMGELHDSLKMIEEQAAEHHDRIVALHERARRETTEAGRAPQPDDVVGIRHRRAAFDEPVTVLGFDAGGEKSPRDYRVVHLGRFEPTRSVRRPWAYVLGPGHDGVVDKLRQHGIEVEPCAGEGRVEIYTVTRIERSPRSFQGHTLLRLEAKSRLEQRTLPVGSVLV